MQIRGRLIQKNMSDQRNSRGSLKIYVGSFNSEGGRIFIPPPLFYH